jgi:uncharacterized protein (TIGR02466 family)
MKIINFSGLPILIIQNAYNISENEISFIENIKYVENEHENCSGLKFSKNKYILQVKKLKKLKETFNLKLDYYLKNILQINNNFLLKNSWTTLQFGKTTHPAHVHPNVLLSMVYYVKCDEGNILFLRDRSLLAEGFHFDYGIIEHNQYNSSSFNLKVKTNDLIIFPAWLRHQASNNSIDKKRYVIGANYFIEGEIGGDKNAAYLKI